METAIAFFLMRMPDVEKAVGLKKSQIYNLIKAGDFPPPVSLGPRSRAWKSSSIQEWINNRPVASNFTEEAKSGGC